MLSSQVSQQPILASSPGQQNKYTCVCCRIRFETGALQREHFKTEWHLYNLKRRVCNLGPIDSESFDKIQSSAPTKNSPSSEKKKSYQQQWSGNSSKPNAGSEAEDIIADDDEDDGDSNWEEVDDENLVDEDYSDEEATEMLARVIPTDTCLFCAKKSATIESHLKHMNLIHGFFIPEDKYMIDIDGLLEYLGFKVGAGATCLWCQKQFSTLKGVRQHMIIKDHCKILFDQDKATDEFKEFYDYSTQEQIKMKPLTELVIIKKRHERRHDGNRSLVKAKESQKGSGSLIIRGNLAMVPGSYQAKNIKKFNAYRAKILLRTGMANNQSMRGRLRQQNPI